MLKEITKPTATLDKVPDRAQRRVLITMAETTADTVEVTAETAAEIATEIAVRKRKLMDENGRVGKRSLRSLNREMKIFLENIYSAFE